ncbi:hypothetical protein [Thiocapsa imhoffii]|nr:hypothetical protein [Thiocapsa imhoffii]
MDCTFWILIIQARRQLRPDPFDGGITVFDRLESRAPVPERTTP